MKTTTLAAALLLILASPPVRGDTPTDTPRSRPNVVLVMTDDQGHADMACHGNPMIKTPAIDRLYSESVRFTDFQRQTKVSGTNGTVGHNVFCLQALRSSLFSTALGFCISG